MSGWAQNKKGQQKWELICENKIQSLGPGDKTWRQSCAQTGYVQTQKAERRKSVPHYCLQQWFSNLGECRNQLGA